MKFTIDTQDSDIDAAITWARERDNSSPSRSPGSQIDTDAEWVQLECRAFLKTLPKEEAGANAQAAFDVVMADFEAKEAGK